MVKIAIAGGNGNVGKEIVDALVASKKHEILIFTRKDVPTENMDSSVKWAKSTYEDVDELIGHLQGIDVVLSFIAPHEQQQGFSTQKNIIDAAVKAGVKRFAPSEWVSAGLEHLDWYAFKAYTRQYLAELNRDRKVIEYCLFQPGLFTNYFTPYPSTKHIKPLEMQWDFVKRRAILREGSDNDYITLTTAEDLRNVVAHAVDYSGEWPVSGGIRGSRISIKEFIALGEEIRGGSFTIDWIPNEDLNNGTWKTSWVPKVEHPAVQPEFVEAFSKKIVGSFSLAIGAGCFDVGDEWNRLLPDYQFTDAKDFLRKAWRDKH
ncbi:NmrA-like family protein [Alternaria alternata]|nr:NmrA-like family protein [Alternaria alternata]